MFFCVQIVIAMTKISGAFVTMSVLVYVKNPETNGYSKPLGQFKVDASYEGFHWTKLKHLPVPLCIYTNLP
jgi:hypothetical protein